MKIGTWEFSLRKREEKASHDDVLRAMLAVQSNGLPTVTPENCMQSPTVNAVVTAVSRRLSVSPIHVYQKSVGKNGREVKERLPNHPVAILLRKPNGWQSRVEYWLDAVSCFVRHGKYFAFIGRGVTGPIRSLTPLHPNAVEILQGDDYAVLFRVTEAGGGQREVYFDRMHYVRGPARDFLTGDSPVNDVKLSIALEIAAERYGASFFANGAIPLLLFQYMQGGAKFKTAEAEKQFVDDFQNAFSGDKRHRALLLPAGIENSKTPIQIENDKAQMLESRRYQRTVIAGAFGVPPHLVGDLERATFNNVEQQDQDFTSNVVQPVAQAFEAAIERDLLTQDDRNSGIVVRFNLDSILRADFKSRQDGSRIQREGGMLSVNEWREREGMNPIDEEDGGEDYIRPANMVVAGDNNNANTPPGNGNAGGMDEPVHSDGSGRGDGGK